MRHSARPAIWQRETAFLDGHYLCNHSYWAKGRTLEQVKTSIKHSICFGVYVNGHQAGFARVVTDTVTFAYLVSIQKH